jgi:hypothetical protein
MTDCKNCKKLSDEVKRLYQYIDTWKEAMNEMGEKYMELRVDDKMGVRSFIDEFYIQLEAMMGW